MTTGLDVRLNQLRHPSSQRILAVAFDHGGSGVPPGGGDVTAVTESILASGVDAVLLGAGVAERSVAGLSRPGAPRLVISVDSPIFSSVPGKGGHTLLDHRRTISVQRALAAGATAVKVLFPVGHSSASGYGDSLQLVAGVVEDAHEYGLPVMVEPVGWGPEADDSHELAAHLNRISVEVGADLVKLPAPADMRVLERIIDHSPVPVVMVGGAARSSVEFVGEVENWLKAGAAGLVVGRNIWSRPHPARAAQAMIALVHDNNSAEALRLLDEAERTS